MGVASSLEYGVDKKAITLKLTQVKLKIIILITGCIRSFRWL